MMDRLVPSGIVEQWMTHLRRQRSRANDMIWLTEQREVVADVNRLEELYMGINEGRAHFGRVDPSDEPDGTMKKPARHWAGGFGSNILQRGPKSAWARSHAARLAADVTSALRGD
jgi:hypothetical protein